MSKQSIQTSRLSAEQLADNFVDLHPPLSWSEASIEADRCYFCYDAPCITACPTGIDIPGFIQKIRSGNIRGAAQTILSENIMGAMCARVCPTEVLCEGECVRNCHEDKPVEIGLLQRYATDALDTDSNVESPIFKSGAPTGKHIAIVGAGPAGLSCAHRLAMLGHKVTIYEAKDKPSGLNEYGIADYKATNNIAQREVEFILSIGGIELNTKATFGEDVVLEKLRSQFDAVFLGIGLGAVNQLNLAEEETPGVMDAVSYIADLRQSADKTDLPVGENIVVVGGGMTAIDIAVQSKLLGAEEVTIVYRRGEEEMGASDFERILAQTHDIKIIHWAAPRRLIKENNFLSGVELETMALEDNGALVGTGKYFSLRADVVFKAIGQKLVDDGFSEHQALNIQQGRIIVDADLQTSLDGVWAGGDCVSGGDNLTVSAVQDGKLAAISIDKTLNPGGNNG